MSLELDQIPGAVLNLAKAALAQANTHAVFMGRGSEHWPMMSVLNAAHAGELFIKAIIASAHPLLIFKDLFILDDDRSEQLDLQTLLLRGRTYDFEKLPQVFWAVTGRRVPDLEIYQRVRRARNAVQHFCPPIDEDLSRLSLEFIYSTIDPLIAEYFGLYAIEYHEDHSVGYDYIVAVLLKHQIRFSLPTDFSITEVDLGDQLGEASDIYRAWFRSELERIGKVSLIDF